ncbi:unnamed protein product [Closterium sp. NIES-64]|nr:unnamed protein product [Closterium sp. NIES-65]CAI5988556.1 unnamed protein product [Closterium sp. NIES-64]
MLNLPPAPWEDGGSAPFSPASPPTRSMAALLASLSLQRRSRELGLQLRAGLRDVRAEFSYVRLRGLRKVGLVVESAAESDELADVFRESQQYSELQLVPAICEHCIGPSTADDDDDDDGDEGLGQRGGRPMAPTAEEVEVALHVLEGCCLLDPATSRQLAASYDVVKDILIHLSPMSSTPLGDPPPSLMACCLNALPAILLASPQALESMDVHKGVLHVAPIVKDRQIPLYLRAKAVEFLALFLAQLTDLAAGGGGGSTVEVAGRWLGDAVHDLEDVVGERAAQLIEGVATGRGAVLSEELVEERVTRIAEMF